MEERSGGVPGKAFAAKACGPWFEPRWGCVQEGLEDDLKNSRSLGTNDSNPQSRTTSTIDAIISTRIDDAAQAAIS